MSSVGRQYSSFDRLVIGLQRLRIPPPRDASNYPAENIDDNPLSGDQQTHSAGLMRVNHAGEIAAQGLYIGQAATARHETTRDLLHGAALEEQQHLAWCHQRLGELSARPSLLAPFWHGGSVAIGILNGLRGDTWSLGFVAETEHQVEEHLLKHLSQLPEGDQRSREIIKQMHSDEAAHRVNAIAAGGRPLPWPVRLAMRASAKVMTITAYRF